MSMPSKPHLSVYISFPLLYIHNGKCGYEGNDEKGVKFWRGKSTYLKFYELFIELHSIYPEKSYRREIWNPRVPNG